MQNVRNLLANSGKHDYCSNEMFMGGDSLRIAVCDDEDIFRIEFKEALYTVDILPNDAAVEDYPDGESLVAAHYARPFNIIFLDIEMDGISGIDAAREIRENDGNVILIFLTSHDEYVLQSFYVETFDFILKPITNQKVKDVLSRALKKHREQHFIVHFSGNNAPYNLETGDIVYIEGEGRNLKVVTKKERYYCSGKLKDYEMKLVPYNFFRCHQNNLINLKYVRSVKDSKIITTYNHEVKMSTRKKQDCRIALTDYHAKYRI